MRSQAESLKSKNEHDKRVNRPLKTLEDKIVPWKIVGYIGSLGIKSLDNIFQAAVPKALTLEDLPLNMQNVIDNLGLSFTSKARFLDPDNFNRTVTQDLTNQ